MSRRKKFCLSFCLTFVIVLSIDSSAFCQDKIIRTNKDTVLAKIIEMTGDKIKFRRHGMKTGPILEIYKNQISKIIYENGSELEMIYDSYYVSPDLLAHPPRTVIKLDFVSPLFNHLTLGYERSLKVGTNLDIKAGLIRFRTNSSLEYAEGFLIKAGVKYVWTTKSIRKGLKFENPLNGKYLKPELIFSYFETFGLQGPITYSNYAICLNFGSQYIIWDALTLDYYTGIGYGHQISSYDATSTYDRNDIERNYNHSHLFFGKKLPLVLNGGVTVGVIF